MMKKRWRKRIKKNTARFYIYSPCLKEAPERKQLSGYEMGKIYYSKACRCIPFFVFVEEYSL